MKRRCDDKNNIYYGLVGIKVCDRWINSFDNFFQDMGHRPSMNHSIDRFPDIEGNYSPDNCRWATPKQQANNRKTNRWLICNGIKKTIAAWSDETGISWSAIYDRINRGLSIDLVLKTKGK